MTDTCTAVYFGSDRFSRGTLEMLLASGVCTVALVVTTPLRRAGRGLQEMPNDVMQLCHDRSIPCVSPEKLKDVETEKMLRDVGADLFIVVSYGKILSQSILSMPKYTTLNVHPSLLPRWRGPSPIQTALLNGDRETGVSIITLTPEIDAGDVIMQERIPLDDDINALALEEKLMQCGGRMLAASVNAVMRGDFTRIPQDRTQVTIARKLSKTDGLIDWGRSARDIHNQIRSLCEWPTAYTFFSQRMVKIFVSRVASDAGEGLPTPGTIMELSKAGYLKVATGSGVLEVHQAQLEGKKRMDAFSLSLGMRIQTGQRFSKEGAQ